MPGYRHTSVVVIGSFNPAIFQPEWFRSNDLLPASEIDFTTADLPHGSGGQRRLQRVLVANDAALVEFESLQLQVVQDRWMLVTERADWQGDLGKIAHDVFALLPHSPVRIVGFNVVVHAAPKGKMPEVLDRLLPLGELGSIAGENAVAAATVKAEWSGWRVTMTLDRSAKLKHGIYLAQNFERDIKGVDELLPVLEAGWGEALDRAREVASRIMER